ncbi:MAG: hypothetical protein Q8P80_03935 [Candidatus Levybacteria bacterium]|nr:hypothetical protein [Candidatus Levybacteria bacterium]
MNKEIFQIINGKKCNPCSVLTTGCKDKTCRVPEIIAEFFPKNGCKEKECVIFVDGNRCHDATCPRTEIAFGKI